MGVYFSSDFGWYSIHFDIVHKNKGEGAFLLNGQNLLSMTKVTYLLTVPNTIVKYTTLRTIRTKDKMKISL